MTHKFYGTSRWKKLRVNYLTMNPLCAYCEQGGQVTPADVVDHIKPHRGSAELFWSENNMQALCFRCHNSTKQSEEKTGRIKGCKLNGEPNDPQHSWYK